MFPFSPLLSFPEQGDLSKPETIPATLVGIHTVIDCATGRPEEPIKTVSTSIHSTTLGGALGVGGARRCYLLHTPVAIY